MTRTIAGTENERYGAKFAASAIYFKLK